MFLRRAGGMLPRNCFVQSTKRGLTPVHFRPMSTQSATSMLSELKTFMVNNKRIILGLSGAVVMIVGHRIERHDASEKPSHDVEVVDEDKENFFRFMRFGMVDMSILLMSLVAGVSLDGVIARFVGVQGYGAIVGAGLGNCFADVIAGLPEGVQASLGVGAGTLLPLLPLLIPMTLKLPFSRGISLAFGASSLGFCILAFVWGYQHREQEHEKHKDPSVDKLVGEVETLIRGGDIKGAISILEKKA